MPSNSKTQPERVSKGKPSSLLGLAVSDEGKKVFKCFSRLETARVLCILTYYFFNVTPNTILKLLIPNVFLNLIYNLPYTSLAQGTFHMVITPSHLSLT